MNKIQKISVCGLGKLGACLAATLAVKGFPVVGYDIDSEKVNKLQKGLPPVEEPRLAETIQQAGGNLVATTNLADVVDTDVTFFIIPSPSLPDGSFSNEFLIEAMRSVARAVKNAGKKGHLFVCSSTTTPGSCEAVLIPAIERELEGTCGVDFGFCYNPEFIALGNVIQGLLEPDMVLIGEAEAEHGLALEDLYKRYNQNSPRVERMSLVSAELTKISINSYVTMKISFTNQLRMIADRFPNADIHSILDAVGSDSRIGKKYLRAGLSYGGPCFPRDNRLLAYVARQKGVGAPLAEATDLVNVESNKNLFETVVEKLENKKDKKVAVLGLAYKPDTYIVEEAAGFILAQNLKKSGFDVIVHDFAATQENTPELVEFEYLEGIETLVDRDDVALAVVCCPWPDYEELVVSKNTSLLRGW